MRFTGQVAALAGGVGGARLVDGLRQVMAEEQLTVIVNTGDDFRHFGLLICPDLDTVCYTLAGVANPQTGWGRAEESWLAMETLEKLGGPTWFRLGDRDLGWHLERTRRISEGQSLSQITADFCRRSGIKSGVLPMSDDSVSTRVYTSQGDLPFQEYFAAQQCRPQVSGFRFDGIEQACPTKGVIEAILAAELVVICPSNPWVSIDPILAIEGVSKVVAARPVVAVSPIIAGKAVKGPAAKMFAELGIEPSALAVAQHYTDLLNGLVIDIQDEGLAKDIESLGIQVAVEDTLMKSPGDRSRLAGKVLEFGKTLLN